MSMTQYTRVALVALWLGLGTGVRLANDMSDILNAGDSLDRLTATAVEAQKLRRNFSELTLPWHWWSNNNIEIEATRQEQKLRDDNIIDDDETLELAFKVGSDKSYLTSKRVIFRYKSLLSPVTEYKSVLYSSIKSWSVQTTGRFPDMDTHLELHTSTAGLGTITKKFQKGRADIFRLGRAIGSKLLGTDTQPSSRDAQTDQELQDGGNDFWAWLAGDLIQVDAATIEEKLRRSAPFLGPEETVDFAFKIGEKLLIFTQLRLVMGDMMGLIWERSMRYTSIPWHAVQAFDVSGVNGDYDTRLTFYTEVTNFNQVTYRSLRRKKADVQSLMTYLAMHVLTGGDTVAGISVGTQVRVKPQVVVPWFGWGQITHESLGTVTQILSGDVWADFPEEVGWHGKLSEVEATEASSGAAQPAAPVLSEVGASWITDADFMDWFRGLFGTVSPAEAEANMRAHSPGLFLEAEVVEQAYRITGSSMFLFTSHRILWVTFQLKFFSSNSLAYMTMPYRSVHAFNVKSAASWDLFSYFELFTSIHPPPCKQDSNGNQQCLPGMSALTVDLRAGRVDARELQAMLSSKILGSTTCAYSGEPTQGLPYDGDFWDFIQGGMRQIDSTDAEAMFCRSGILLQDEVVEWAFKLHNDTTVFTDRRLLIVDSNSFSGFGFGTEDGYSIRSIPYSSLRSFDVTSAGNTWLSPNHNLRFYTDMWWLASTTLAFEKGTVDIFDMQAKLLEKIIGVGHESASLLESAARKAAMGGQERASVVDEDEEEDAREVSLLEAAQEANRTSFSWRNFKQIDVQAATDEAREDNVLMEDESIWLAFEVWGDKLLLTSRRIIFRDVSKEFLFWGKKVRYLTLPFNSVDAYAVRSGGFIDGHMEMGLWMDSSSMSYFHANFKRKSADIMQIGRYLDSHVLTEENMFVDR